MIAFAFEETITIKKAKRLTMAQWFTGLGKALASGSVNALIMAPVSFWAGLDLDQGIKVVTAAVATRALFRMQRYVADYPFPWDEEVGDRRSKPKGETE